MKVFVLSLGCDKNWSDSEYLVELLSRRETVSVVYDPFEADVVIVNSCAFVRAAIEESLDAVFEWSSRGKKVVLAGCLPSRYAGLADVLTKELPEVVFFSPHGTFESLVENIENLDFLRSSKLPFFLSAGKSGAWAYLHPPKKTFLSYPYGYIKLTEGCNRKCTFCVIPKIRGKQVSRRIEEIEKELNAAVESGLKEIIFVGQSTSDWEGSWEELSGLIDRYSAYIPWFRFLYLNPESVWTGGIISLFREGKVLPYFDISFQHVSQRLLKLMGRQPLEVEAVVSKLREEFPEAIIRSSFIVGFPTETREEFDQLMEFIDKGYVDYPAIFAYSDEEGAPSSLLSGKLPEEEIRGRYEEALELSQRVVYRAVSRWIGSIQNVIIEGTFEGGYLARAWFQAPDVDGKVRVASYGKKDEESGFMRVIIEGFYDEENLLGRKVDVSGV